MGKKKDNTPDDNDIFGKALEMALNSLSESQRENLMDYIQEHGADSLFSGPNPIYQYKRPDYAKDIKPIAEYLQLLWDSEDDDLMDLCSAVGTVCDGKPKDEIEKDVRNYILNVFVDFYISDDDIFASRLTTAFWILEHYHLASCLDIVLEALRQNQEFYNCYFDINREETVSIVYQLGKDQLPRLLDFMKESNLIPEGRTIVFDAVAHLYLAEPARRLETAQWLCDALNHFCDASEEDVFEPNIDHYAFTLLTIQAREALPIMKKLYERFEVPALEVPGGYKELAKAMNGNDEEERCRYYSVDEWMKFVPDEDDDDDELFDGDDDDFETFIESQPAKKYRISVKLKKSPVKISRELVLPSNISLEYLAETIQAAMGWSGGHLHHFIKDNIFYVSAEMYEEDQNEGWSTNERDDTGMTLGDMLQQKGNCFVFEYDFGDSWMHEIKLMEVSEYQDNENRHEIFLKKGAGACPPEDCGGVYGYAHLIEVMAHPRGPEYKQMKEWLGGKLYPDDFDIEEARERISDFNSLDF
jgi:hypothetical protein